jgi:hypothetical protein
VVPPKLPRCPTFGDLRCTANQNMCQDPQVRYLGSHSRLHRIEAYSSPQKHSIPGGNYEAPFAL